MKEQCKQAVAKALGKASLNAQEVQNIEARINQAMVNLARKDIDHWRGLTDLEKLSAASKQVAEDIQADFARKKRIAVQDILIQNKNLAILQDQVGAIIVINKTVHQKRDDVDPIILNRATQRHLIGLAIAIRVFGLESL